MGAFGEKLRKQREQRNIALDAISNTTKISTRMLRALEDEHFDQLPGGVFNKGFVRAYARQVGLDEEEAIADYLTALRESQIQAQSILPDFRDLHNHDPRGNDSRDNDVHGNALDGNALAGNDHLVGDNRSPQIRRNATRHEDHSAGPNSGPSSGRSAERRSKDFPPLPDLAVRTSVASPPAERFRQRYPAGNPGPATQPSRQIPWGKLAVALLCLTLVLALWNSRHHAAPTAVAEPIAASSSSQSSSNQSPAPLSVAATTSPTAQRSGAVPSPKGSKASPADTLTLSSGKISPGTISPANTASPASTTIMLSTAPTSPPTLQAEPVTPSPAESAAKRRGASAAVAKTLAAIPLKTFTLLIRAEKTTWVSIMADGKPVAQETLIAPAHTSVRATGEVIVKAGNAAGVSFQLNGKDVAAEGNEGEVKSYVFDATGLRAAPPTQPPDPNR